MIRYGYVATLQCSSQGFFKCLTRVLIYIFQNVVEQRRMQYESHTEAIEQKMSELELQSCKKREAEAKVRLEKLNSTNKDR